MIKIEPLSVTMLVTLGEQSMILTPPIKCGAPTHAFYLLYGATGYTYIYTYIYSRVRRFKDTYFLIKVVSCFIYWSKLFNITFKNQFLTPNKCTAFKSWFKAPNKHTRLSKYTALKRRLQSTDKHMWLSKEDSYLQKSPNKSTAFTSRFGPVANNR